MKVRRVLVADDTPEVQLGVVESLERKGFIVHAVENGEELLLALEYLEKFDAIVTDDSMPKMNGTEALRHIKGDSRYEHLRLVVISGTAREHEAMAVGAALLVKPYRARELMELLAD